MFDIWPYKVKELLKKTGIVILWILASGAFTALYAYTQEIELNTTNTLLANALAIINVGLFFIVNYLRTIDPRRAAKKIATDSQVAS